MTVRTQLVTTIRKKAVQVKWAGLLNSDTGTPETLQRYAGRITMQVLGTFGAGGSVQLEGSNDGGTTWVVLFDNRGTGAALTFTAAGMRSLNDLPALIRPNVTAGDGTTTLTVLLSATL
jgi:hypothetical protein